MATRVFISYDYDNDVFLKEALVGQSKLPDSPFEISDWSIMGRHLVSGPWAPVAGRRDPWLQAPGLAAAGEAYRGSLAIDDPR
jgi:hypothetical protein